MTFDLFLFIFGLAVVAAGLLAFKFGWFNRSVLVTDSEDPDYRRGFNNYRKEPLKWPAGLIVAAGVLVGIIYPCVAMVGATEAAIETNFGRVGDSVSSGLQLKAPWTSLIRFNTNFQQMEREVNVNGSDGGTMVVKYRIRYSINVENAGSTKEGACEVKPLLRIARSESALEERVVASEGDKALRGAFAPYPAFEGFTSKQGDVQRQAETTLAIAYEAKCVKFDNLTIVGIAPSPKVQESIDAAIAAAQKINQATKDAETARKTAEGNADAARIAAQGAADAKITEANAERDAAAAKAQANDTLTKSLTPEVLQKLYIDALANGSNKVIVTNGQAPVLTMPADTPSSTPPTTTAGK